jgi:hypothetical protein
MNRRADTYQEDGRVRATHGRAVPRAAGGLLLAVLLFAGLPAPLSWAQSDHGFQFVRVRFEDGRSGGRRWGGGAWSHDHPTAELNLYEALKRTTGVHVDGPPLVLTLDDERIFEYPLLYLCEPGYWQLSDEQAVNLRDYLQRGGFILFDDFGGAPEWNNLLEQMRRVLPDRAFVEIPPEHPIWDIYFDIDPVAAPANVSPRWGQVFSPADDRYLAIFDDEGRMIALACLNQDIGDGWEWPEQNFENASTISFQMGINFLMYALTH